MDTLDRMGVLERFAALREAVATLNNWLPAHTQAGAVYPLPVLSEAEVPPLISPGLESDAEAARLGGIAFAQFERLDEQHPSTVARVPGWLQLDTDPAAFVDPINELKQHIQDTLRAAFSSTSKRAKACRTLFPRVAMNQLYRQIHVVDASVGRISFIWQPTTVARRKLSVDEALALLAQAEQDPLLMARPGAADAVAIARRQVGTLTESSHYQLILSTPVAPHPRVALFNVNESRARKTHHANLPLLLAPRDKPLRVRALPDFDAGRRKKPRGQPKRVLDPLCELVHLYGFHKAP